MSGTKARRTAPVTGDSTPRVEVCEEHILEIVSDSGEGAQTAGKMFAKVSARMGNGVWTVEIIPAEIEPPFRSRAGASGNRIRLGSGEVTNAGDQADVVVGFNEQVLYSRIDQEAMKPGTRIFLENKWGSDPDPEIRRQYAVAVEDFRSRDYIVYEVPMEERCLEHVEDPRRGKNMWVVGMLASLYRRDLERMRHAIGERFSRKGEKVIASNVALLEDGHAWAEENLDIRFEIPSELGDEEMVVMNGNQAIGLGCMAAGMELCSMYPITPATSASHYLASAFHKVGGFVHQAEDEIAAVGFAIGASYAGKTAVTITSGPGLALKSEFLGLAVMAEIPLVVVVVQRGGPSTGLPTKVEQGDLMAALFAQPGDAPRVVMAPSTIEECFHFMVTARKLAETFRGPVLVLSDANLATGVQPFRKPHPRTEWLSPPVDQSRWEKGVRPYDWDSGSGLSPRPIPGQPGGEYVLTGLAHDERSKVAYESAINQRAMAMRSRKLLALQSTLKPPVVNGDDEGELLVVGWGSTRGAIEEAIEQLRAEGASVSSLHLRFLSPLEPGLKDIFARFDQVMTVEINYGDDENDATIPEGSRRYAQLATLLRATLLADVGSWSRVPGYPLQPGVIAEELRRRLNL